MLSDDLYFYGSHASTDFLSRGRKITNFPDPIGLLNPVSGETIIASPSRMPELEEWARANPGGELHYRYDCDNIILLAMIIAITAAIWLRRNEKVHTYAMEVGSELSKVTWPTWKDTKRATIVVIVTTLVIASILGLLDLAWGALTRLFYGA